MALRETLSRRDGEGCINSLGNLFISPEFYPLSIDFQKHTVRFVRMSRDAYRQSVFLDGRVRHLGTDRYEIRIDDLLLGAANTSPVTKPAHYILHTTFCCSTLLARYFELHPHCFVLKEPGLLTQLALEFGRWDLPWREVYNLGVRLLTRTYEPGEFVVIKPHEPVNVLASLLLRDNAQTTLTFLSTPLRSFLLSVLKAQERRDWVQRRIHGTAASASACPALADINLGELRDPEAAAYLWLVNQFLCTELISGPFQSRVLILDGGQVAGSPGEVLSAVGAISGIPLDEELIGRMLNHPSVQRYSKNLSRPFNASSRQHELAELESYWGAEADIGVEWAVAHGMGRFNLSGMVE